MTCHFDLKCFEDKNNKQIKKLRLATFIAIFFMLLELVGGIVANSLALISDALHMFTDVGAFVLSLIVLKIAKRPSSSEMSYGYKRAEVLGALASGLTLWALCGVLIYKAIMRIITPHEVAGGIVFVIATFGLLSNIAMMKILHSHNKEEQLNVKAAYLHVLGDLFGSIGVIVSGILIYFTHWNIIDPLITLLFAVVILFTSGKIIRKTIKILMEGTPSGIKYEEVKEDLLILEDVKEVHDLHIWSISTKHLALSAHLVSERDVTQEAIELVQRKYKIFHTTIQIDRQYCPDQL